MKKLLSFYLFMLCTIAMYAQPQLLEKTLMQDGLERRYLVYVPAAYDGSEAWPVVLNYHELNSVPEDIIAVNRMNEIADTAHFLVVYPEAVVVPNFGVPGVTSDSLELWNDGFLPDIGIDDVGFTSSLIDVLATDYQVDLTRVYATGFGSGGGMVGRLACELNHRIAAIADVEGFIGCIPDNPMPTLIMFGTADPFVPYEGGGLFPPVRGFVDNWAAANGCSGMPTETDLPDINTADSSTVTLLTYNDCAAGGETLFYRINNGGRSHPGADPMDYPPEILAQIGNINQDINASSEIWNFLKQFDRPQPQLLEQIITVDGVEREYLLYVPAAYDGSEEWPLVLNFHGATSNPAEQAFVTGMNATADTANFLIAYPAGISNPEMTDTGWNDPMLPELQDDVKFTSHLIDVISNEYNIDPARIYAAGTSNGGGMVYTLACELADRIAAFASVTGPSLLDCDPGRPVPILQMHGTADLIVPFNGGMGIFVPREFPAVRDRISYWADKNGCVGEPEITEFPDINTADSSTVTLERYTNCEGNAEIAFYVVDNGGHTWPGGAPIPPPLEGFFGNVNRDINASSEIWNFFNRHVHPNPAVPQLLERTITVDGIERRYLVYVPGTYKGNEDWPLVLNLHGYLDNPEAQVFISQMNIVADTAEFIIAYPAGELVSLADIEGLPPFIPPQGPGWNLGGDISENDDLGFLVQMIDSIANEFAINESRIYSTGLSMGGITSYMLACAYPDRIAAIAPVAANLLPEEGQIDFSCNPTSPVPVLHIHGTNDIIDPFEPSIVFRGAISSVNFWRDQNGCSNTPVETMFPDIDTEDGSTVTSIKYNDCESDSEVWLYRIDDGGHNWPGGAPLRPGFDILGPVNRDINASSEIWNFFNRHVHPNPAVPQLLERTITVDGLEREYLLYVPAAYDGSEEWPLVLNFHGYLSNPFEQIFASQMNLVADTAHFLVAYPVGLPIDASDIEGEINPILPSAGPGWNVYGFLAEHDDLEFTKQIIQQTDSEFALDNDRVYATGMSFGGIMTYYLACELNDQIAAFASVTGDLPKDQRFDCAPDKSVPILHIHGTEDPIAPYDGSLIGIGPEATVQFWRDQNQCMSEPSITPFENIDTTDGSTVTLFEYDCADDSEVLFYRIDGGGHTWPNGLPAPPGFEFLGTVNQDIFASSEIWNFFNRYELSESTSVETVTPATFNLRVFPNPASTQVTFSFALPQSARVQLTLHNAIGQRAQTLHDGQLPQGEQQFTWQRDGLPQGTYFYRLRVNDQITSAPVILVR